MATVIDSLVVELGLDPKGAQKGAADFRQELKKTRDVADTGAKDIEAYGKKASAFFGSLRNEAIGLFLAFQGASSITGFVQDLLHGDAATGRFAANIGMATSRLSAWQLAVQEMGGDSKDATAALGSMKQMFMSWQLTGTTGHDADLLGLGVDKKSLSDPEQALLKIAEMAKKLPKDEFYARASRLGIPDSVINTLEKGRHGVEELIKAKEKDGAATQAQADAAAEFERQSAKLKAHLMGELRPAIYQVVSGLDAFLGRMDKANLTGPVFGSVLVGIAGAAVAAAAPFLIIPGAIAAATFAMDKFLKSHPDVQKRLDSWEAPLKNLLPKSMQWLFDRDVFSGKGPAPAGGGGDGGDLSAVGASGGGKGPPGGSSYIEGGLTRAGFTAEQARGISAGITAEGGSLGMAANGAYGIGQWRGERQKKLFAFAGNRAPNLAQQMAFLISELKGGDAGGASVRKGGSADDTMVRYLRDFMRPQGRHNEHYMDLVRDVGRGRGTLARSRRAAARGGGGGSSSTVHVGAINIHTPTTDPAEHGRIARDAIRRRLIAAQSNRGQD